MLLSAWLGFLAASILIAVSPGPGAAISMSTGMRYGFSSALRVIGGLQCALLIQLGIVGAGLGAILSTFTWAFDAVRLAGAAYLVWLGIQKWRAAPYHADENGASAKHRGLFREGVLVNLSNPKAVVFMTALLPQFIDPERPQWPQFLVIAATLCTTDIIVMSLYALLAARLGSWLRDARAQRWQNRFFGSVFVCAGLWLAVSERG